MLGAGSGAHGPWARGGRPGGPGRALASAVRKLFADLVPELAGLTVACRVTPAPGGPLIG